MASSNTRNTASPSWLRRAIVLLIPALLAVGCGAEGAQLAPASLDQDSQLSRSGFTVANSDSRDHMASGDCLPAQTQECRVYLAAYNGVQPCFVGTQYCIDNSWSHCLDSDLVDANDHDALLAIEERFDDAEDLN